VQRRQLTPQRRRGWQPCHLAVIACAILLVAARADAQEVDGGAEALAAGATATAPAAEIPEALLAELPIAPPDPRRGVWELEPIVLEPPPYVWVPDPDLQPVDTSLPPPVPITDTGARTLFAIKLILGLIALAILAYLGGHRSVVRLQERLGIANVIAAGLPFVALGVFAGHPAVGILSGDVLTRVRPILEFGLGWLGFIIGAQLDIRVLDKVPRGTAYLITVEALAPFLVTAAACGAVMLAFGASLEDGALWRDLVLLGTAAAMTAPRRFRGFANRTWREGKSVDTLLGQLDEIVGVVGLLFLTAYLRGSTGGTWQLPDTAWLFVSLGLGVALGALFFAMVRVPVSNAEFLAVILGSIAFASGLAGYLGLSPIVICFIAGTLVINFPCDQRESIFRILNHLERPIHVLFLVVAGAVWSIGDWRGWVLVPLFVAARTAGKWLGVLGAHASVGDVLPEGFADRRTLVSPLSSLSIALVVSVESLHRAPTLAWVTTAVIGGAFLIELVVQFLPEPRVAVPRRSTEQPAVDVATATATTAGPVSDEIERPPMKPRPPTLAFRIEPAATGAKKDDEA
jgi:Kef-type K+ transport system membrane component KefB